jgi:hypothetical protein
MYCNHSATVVYEWALIPQFIHITKNKSFLPAETRRKDSMAGGEI